MNENDNNDISKADVHDLDQITRRFKRVLVLINSLIVITVIWLLCRAVSPKLAQATERLQAVVMTGALVLLAVVHGYSLRKTRVQDIERIRFLTMHDGLTQVYNLRYLNQTVDQEIHRSNRFGHAFALLYTDLDGFKEVNDTHGHGAGDTVLVAVSQLLSSTCRVTDMVGRVSGVVGRIGGDEFLVLMPETDAASARHLAHRFIERIDDLRVSVEGGGEACGIGASIGIASYPDDGQERKALIKVADSAMYRAKQEGGNCYSDSSETVYKPLEGRQEPPSE